MRLRWDTFAKAGDTSFPRCQKDTDLLATGLSPVRRDPRKL